MKPINIRDVEKVRNLLSIAKIDPIGKRLAEILDNINPEIYQNATVITDKTTYGLPCADTVSDDATVILHDVTTGDVINIDSLEPQFRWDAVCAIWNQLNNALIGNN